MLVLKASWRSQGELGKLVVVLSGTGQCVPSILCLSETTSQHTSNLALMIHHMLLGGRRVQQMRS